MYYAPSMKQIIIEEDRALSLTEHGSDVYTDHGAHRLDYHAVIKDDMLQEYLMTRESIGIMLYFNMHRY